MMFDVENSHKPNGESLQDFVSRLDVPRDGTHPEWLNELKEDAWNSLKHEGFPHAKVESWEFSQVRKILSDTYGVPEGKPSLEEIEVKLRPFLTGTGIPSLVYLDGVLVPGMSDIDEIPEGLKLVSPGELNDYPDFRRWIVSSGPEKGREGAFRGLNLLLSRNPVLLYAFPGKKVSGEINLVFASTGRADHRAINNPAVYVYAGEKAEASVIEVHTGLDQGKYLSNSATVITAQKGSSLNHVKVISEGKDGYHLSTTAVELDEQASVKTHSLMRSGSVIRNEVKASLNGEGAEAGLYGLYLTDGERRIENSTCIEHNKPECVSREHYKGILGDSSRAVFRGRIVVAQDAQKTDSEQKNDNLLISDEARINSKPQLEIYADDVSCTHGATVGQLEDEKIFYLQSRGISRREAAAILIRAFGNEIITGVESDRIRPVLEREPLLILD